jgi:hypothetical protein
MLRYLQKSTNIYPGSVQIIIHLHSILGFFLIGLGKSYTLFAWYLSKSYIVMIFLGTYIILSLIGFMVFRIFGIKNLS